MRSLVYFEIVHTVREDRFYVLPFHLSLCRTQLQSLIVYSAGSQWVPAPPSVCSSTSGGFSSGAQQSLPACFTLLHVEHSLYYYNMAELKTTGCCFWQRLIKKVANNNMQCVHCNKPHSLKFRINDTMTDKSVDMMIINASHCDCSGGILRARERVRH